MRKLIRKDKNIPVFWFQAIQEWSVLNYKPPQNCPITALLQCNSALDTAYVFRADVIECYKAKGIYTIQDFLNYSSKLAFSTYFTRAINKSWPTQQFAPLQSMLDLNTPITVRAINAWMQRLNQMTPVRVWSAWAMDSTSSLVGQSWTNICNIRKQFVSIKLQSFYWRYIHRGMMTNETLVRFHIRTDHGCVSYTPLPSPGLRMQLSAQCKQG